MDYNNRLKIVQVWIKGNGIFFFYFFHNGAVFVYVQKGLQIGVQGGPQMLETHKLQINSQDAYYNKR